MKLVRDTNPKKLTLMDDDKLLFSMSFFSDEFVWHFYTDKPIIITRDVDETFFEGLKFVMNNDYIFYPSSPNYKTATELIWLSDQYVDYDDEVSVMRTNRLYISRMDDAFRIQAFNPYFDKESIHRKIKTIAFSPGGNGQPALSMEGYHTLQDDIVNEIFFRCIEPEKVQKMRKA